MKRKAYTLAIFSIIVLMSCSNGEKEGTPTEANSNDLVDTLSTTDEGYDKAKNISVNTNTTKIDTITLEEYKKGISLFKQGSLVKRNDNVIKDDDKIIIKLSNNKSIVLKDSLADGDDVDQVSYKYEGKIDGANYHVIQVTYYETGEYLLINADTGEKATIWSLPKLSPDGKRVLAFNSSLDYDIMPNGIQVLDISEGNIELVWELKPDTWAPQEVDWGKDNVLYIKQHIPYYISPKSKDEINFVKLTFE